MKRHFFLLGAVVESEAPSPGVGGVGLSVGGVGFGHGRNKKMSIGLSMQCNDDTKPWSATKLESGLG